MKARRVVIILLRPWYIFEVKKNIFGQLVAPKWDLEFHFAYIYAEKIGNTGQQPKRSRLSHLNLDNFDALNKKTASVFVLDHIKISDNCQLCIFSP